MKKNECVWRIRFALVVCIWIFEEGYSKDLTFDFDVRGLIESLSKVERDNFSRVLQNFYKQGVSKKDPNNQLEPNEAVLHIGGSSITAKTGLKKRSWPQNYLPPFEFLDDIHPGLSFRLNDISKKLFDGQRFQIKSRKKRSRSAPIKMSHLGYLTRQSLPLSQIRIRNVEPEVTNPDLLTHSESSILEKVKRKMKRTQEVIPRSRGIKKSVNGHGFGLDVDESAEPFERSVREQEGRRYLLWRKVTG